MSSSDRSCSLNNSESSLTSLCVDISPSSSNFFEVLYVGKIKVCRNSVVANTFIDDALEKFRLYELEKKKLNNKELIGTIGRLKSEDNVIFLEKTDTNKSSNIPHHSQLAQRSTSSFNINNHQISDNNNVDDPNTISELTELKSSLINVDNNQQQQQNRTMLLQVDRADLRLISPDRKGILLHKHQKDMINCIQGITAPDYFGFICKEINNADEFYFVGYIFKCESASIAADAVAALSQSSSSSSTSSLFAESNNKIPSNSCEHCPILWYNKLNDEIDEHPNLSDRKIQSVILKRLDQLDPEEQMLILTKFREADSECSIKEQNEFLMKLLRAHCNNKQIRHIHDTAENRSEFLNQYLGVGGKNVFSKAKKSISNSFDHFLKKRTSSSTSPNNARQTSLPFSSGNNNLNKELSPSLTQIPTTSTADDSEDSENNNKFSSRSSPHLLLLTDESQSEINNSYAVVNSDNRTSPISDRGSKMDIFLKVGHNNNANSISKSSAESSGSWRQAILKKVITPKEADDSAASSIISNRKRNNAELRELWKKAIKQAILLVRMDKENRRLKLEQVESAVKRVKLDYDEMKLNQRSEVMDVWEMITNKDLHVKCDKSMLLQAIRQGVPRNKRGDVWFSLAEQHCTNSAPPDPQKYPNYNTPYEQLLRQLTSHQHAILIDLGRTFPQHSYFVSPMGPGQLALFNLLKAYSLLDPEVGYCQGLSFVAGILLLHMDEAEAFILLRHLMFRRGLRTQYLPDMIGLQIKLYQLSRLVHDQLPDLYRHLEIAEVVPSLYAAPWILTLFASQFPLGFAARVFDLVFLEGAEVIFKIALALLSFHKDEILKCENFEDIMEYFKETISSVDKVTLEKLMKLIYTHHTTDISKLLDEYKVEYQVLQEEMESVQPKLDRLRNIERDHKLLMEKNKALLAQLEFSQTNVQRLEKTRVLQQAQLNRTEMQSRGLDVTVATLGNFIQNLIEQKVDIEIPDEVRRILSQITALERNKQETETNKMQKNNNLLRMLQEKNKEQINRISTPQENKTMLKSLSTGKIILPTTLQESVTRTNSLNSKNLQDNNILIPQLKNQYAEKKSQFFSNSHNSILEKQKFHNSQNSSINSIIDIDIQDYDDDNNNKSNNEETFAAIEMLKKEASSSSSTSTATDGNHPFSNCGDVQFTFSGTKELKHFKSLNKTTK